MLYKSYYASPLGELLLLSDAYSLRGLWFVDQKYYASHYAIEQASTEKQPLHQVVSTWLDAYFAGENPSIKQLPLAPEVTPYRQRVLALLQMIPYGQVRTYKQLADELNRQAGEKITSARAVGGAVGHNPLSIIIPCHRVVGSDGSLTGFAGGLERKVALLVLEGFDSGALAKGRVVF